MALTWKARSVLALTAALGKVGLAPTTKRILAMPMAKRIGSGPPKGLIGPVPEVAHRDHQVTTRDGASIRVRVYRPEGATTPVLYAHGGGFMTGGINACDHLCRRLAVESHAVVCSVEYRLFPAQWDPKLGIHVT